MVARREVMAMVDGDQWREYDLRALTMISSARYDAELMCAAHSKGVRALLRVETDVSDIQDQESMDDWVVYSSHAVTHKFLDGVQIDLSEGCLVNQTCITRVASMIERLKGLETTSVTVALALPWSPTAIDGRMRDVSAIIQLADIVIVEASDMRRNVFDRCIASSSTPSAQIGVGLQHYLDQGVAPSHVVLALPWYGLDYPCVSLDASPAAVCVLTPLASALTPCGDGAAYRVDLSQVFSSNSTASAVWDVATETWFNTYHLDDGSLRQIWYDDLQSLSRKFQIAKRMGLGGIGVLSIPPIHAELQTNLLRSAWQL